MEHKNILIRRCLEKSDEAINTVRKIIKVED